MSINERGQLTQAQILRLVTAIEPAHVENKRGMTYMAQHEVRAELTRVFGFGNWDTQVESMECLYEKQIQKGEEQYPTKGSAPSYWVTCYKASVRLTIRDYQGREICSFLEYHAEENAPLPNRGEAHAMAITSVESYALRRAAIGLGDRLGLGLYAKGSTAPLVMRTLQLDDPGSPQVFNPAGQKAVQPGPVEVQQAPVQVGSPDAQRPGIAAALSPARTRELDNFKGVQATVQASNEAARQAPADPYLERVAAGFKHDERDNRE
jgi:hypothetical protein